MKPNLTLPAAPTDSKADFPTLPLDVQAWLTRLPPLDTHTALVKMQNGLLHLLHADMSSRDRAQCLDHFRRNVTSMGLKFQRYLVGLSLPLSQQTLEVSGHYGDLYGTLAAGYKRIILDSDGCKVRGVNLAAVGYWAMYYLLQQLRSVYGSYSRTPKGVWYEIHQIFDLARFAGIQHKEVRVGGQRVRTITHLYKRGLLMGLSDPYHLPFRAVDRIYGALDRWAERVSLRTESPPGLHHCLFMVDFELDRPAMPLLPNARMRLGTNRLALDTSKLVVHLKRKMTRTYNETVVQSTKSQDTDWFVTFEQVETLRNLVIKWGLHPIRRDKRAESGPEQECELVAGLSAVHYVLNGHQPLPQRTIGARSVTSSMMMGTFGLAQTEQQLSLGKRQTWRIQDESDNGIRLLLEDTRQAQVRVGDLVAFKVPARLEDWTLGAIRWAQTLDDGTLSIGVRKLGSGAQAVSVQLMEDRQNSTDARYLPGLVLPKAAGDEHETLITDQTLYRPGAHIWAENNGRNRIIEPLQVQMTTRSFVRFGFKFAAATDTRATLELVQPFPRAP